MFRSALDKTLGLLPSSWEAAIDLRLRPEIRWRWGGPMNGQDGRMAMVRELLNHIEAEQVIETGTNRGATTEWFAKIFSGPVLTVEYNRRNFLFSKSILKPFPNVVVFEMDSRAWLRQLAGSEDTRSKATLFYLDAHQTGQSQPVAVEVQIIAEAWSDFAIVIDDVAIPDDPGYAGESLGGGLRLDLAYIVEALPDNTAVFLPTLPAERESGMRRGCAVLAPIGPISKSVDKVSQLRRFMPDHVTDLPFT